MEGKKNKKVKTKRFTNKELNDKFQSFIILLSIFTGYFCAGLTGLIMSLFYSVEDWSLKNQNWFFFIFGAVMVMIICISFIIYLDKKLPMKKKPTLK